MAEIKVRLTGDNADFKKKLEESSAESRLMAAEMREQFGELAHRAGDIAGEAGLGRIGDVLKDLAGGAVLAFGTALVGAIAEGVKKASEFTDAVSRLGIQMGNLQLGKEMGEYIEKLALAGGGGPTKEQLLAGANVMLSAGMREDEVRTWLPRIQRLSAATGIEAGEWSEMIAGGSVGITRGLEHSPLVRGAMAATGRKDPLEALGWAADTTYANALQVMSSTPGGRWQGMMRMFGQGIENLGSSFIDPAGWNAAHPDSTPGGRNLGAQIAPGIYSSNPSMFGGPRAPAADLQDAAKSLKDSANTNQEILELMKHMFETSD